MIDDKAKCPACRGAIRIVDHPQRGGVITVGAVCPTCGWEAPAGLYDADMRSTPEQTQCEHESFAAGLAPLAYFDPRPRLPTAEEEAAHQERHGEKAGWMYRIVPGATYFTPLGRHPTFQRHGPRRDVECHPHVDGRPVRGPEGW